MEGRIHVRPAQQWRQEEETDKKVFFNIQFKSRKILIYFCSYLSGT
jgi:hypothetical protein